MKTVIFELSFATFPLSSLYSSKFSDHFNSLSIIKSMTNVFQEEIDVLESDFFWYCFLRFLLQAQNKLAKTMPLNSFCFFAYDVQRCCE